MGLIGGPGAIPVIVTGGAIIGGSTATLVVDLLVQNYKYKKEGRRSEPEPSKVGWTAILAIWAGLFILEDNSLSYRPLTAQEMQNLGVSENTHAVFESEIDQVNAVAESVALKLQESEEPSLEDSQKLWSEYGSSLSLETKEVLKQIALRVLDHN